MMKNGITAALLLSGLAATAAAQADEDTGFYAGGGVGVFDVQIDDFDDVDETIDRYDSDDTAWKAFGGWRRRSSLRSRSPTSTSAARTTKSCRTSR